MCILRSVGRAGSATRLLVALCGCLLLAAPAQAKKFEFGQTSMPTVTVTPLTDGPVYLIGTPVTYQVTASAPFSEEIGDVSVLLTPPGGPFAFESATLASERSGVDQRTVSLGDIDEGAQVSFEVTYAVPETLEVDIPNPSGEAELQSPSISGQGPTAPIPGQPTSLLAQISSPSGQAVVSPQQDLELDLSLTNVGPSPLAPFSSGAEICTQLPKANYPSATPVCQQVAIPTGAGQTVNGVPLEVSASSSTKLTGAYEPLGAAGQVANATALPSGDLDSTPAIFPIKVIPLGGSALSYSLQQGLGGGEGLFQGEQFSSTLALGSPLGFSIETDVVLCQFYPPAILDLTTEASKLVASGLGQACQEIKGSTKNEVERVEATFDYEVLEDAPFGSFKLDASGEAAQSPETNATPQPAQVIAGGPQATVGITLVDPGFPSGTDGFQNGDVLDFLIDWQNTGIGPLTGSEFCVDLGPNLGYEQMTFGGATPPFDGTNPVVNGNTICFEVTSSLDPGETIQEGMQVEVTGFRETENALADVTATFANPELGAPAIDIAQVGLGDPNLLTQVGYSNRITSSLPILPGDQVSAHLNLIGGPAAEGETYDACVLYPQGIVNLTGSSPSALAGTDPGEWCASNNPQTFNPASEGGGFLTFEVPADSGPGVIALTTEGSALFGQDPSEILSYAPITEQGPSVVAQSVATNNPEGPYDQGDQINFDLLVANTGTEALSGVEACDEVADALSIEGEQNGEVCYQVGNLGVGEIEVVDQTFTVEAQTGGPAPGANALTATSDQTKPFTGSQPFVLGTGSFALSAELVDARGNPVEGDEIEPDVDYAIAATLSNPTVAATSDVEVCVPAASNLTPGAVTLVPVVTAFYDGGQESESASDTCYTAYEIAPGQSVTYLFTFEGVYPSPPGDYSLAVTATEPQTSETVTDAVDYEIIPVSDISSQVSFKIPTDADNAGGAVKFNITAENSSQATAAADGLVGCLSLSNAGNPGSLDFVAGDSSSGLYVNSAGDVCLQSSSLGIGQQSSALAYFEIPLTGGRFDASQEGVGTFCVSAQNALTQPDVCSQTGRYGYETTASSFNHSNKPPPPFKDQALLVRPSKRRVRSGDHLRYLVDLYSSYVTTPGKDAIPLPFFDSRVCHRTPKGMRLDGANRARGSLKIQDSGRKVCTRKAYVPPRKQRRVSLRYKIKRQAPRTIRTKTLLRAVGLGENPGPAGGTRSGGVPIDRAKVSHRRGG